MATTLGFSPLQTGIGGIGIGGVAMPSAYGLGASPLDTLAVARLGGASPVLAAAPVASPLALQAAQQEQMLGSMMVMLLSLMQNSNGAGGGLGSSGGSGSLGSLGSIGGGGSVGSSGGSSGGGSTSGTTDSIGTNSGAAGSVEMAKKYLGRSAISLKGDLKNYTAAGGTGNDCADFVSGILANTQGFKKTGGDASVATFKQHLTQQGWQKVDKSQSKAGDVVIFNGSQHTELVTKDGGKEAIGSNGGATNQSIKTDSLSWGSQEFYHKG